MMATTDTIDAIKTNPDQQQIQVQPRTSGSSGNSSFTDLKFPDNLKDYNYIDIGVYDTSQTDLVNNGIKASIDNVLKGIETAYDGVKSGVADLNNSFGTTGAGNRKLKQKFLGIIKLPFPNEISEELSHQYADEAGWATDVAKKVADWVPLGDLAIKAGGDLEKLAATHSKFTGSQAYKYYENKIQMYVNTDFRSINLSWRLSPNNEQENKKIHEIVKNLKMYSSPRTLAGKTLLRSPHFFKLTVKPDVLNNALQFTEVNITNISVSYSEGGTMEKFKDNLPKTVTLNVTFQDREPKIFDDWKNGTDNDQIAAEVC